MSAWKKVSSSMPQDFVLDPIPFNIFVNMEDMSHLDQISKIKMLRRLANIVDDRSIKKCLQWQAEVN